MTTSPVRRFSRTLTGVGFAIFTVLAAGAACRQPEEASPGAAAESAIPAYAPRPGRAKPVVAVIAENRLSEVTDYIVPYGVLSESGVAEVFSLATQPGPVQMFPALRIQPQATIAEFDARVPDGADYVFVPAVHYTEDPALIGWITAQAGKGATIVGVCDGGWVVANAGLLKGRKAVGHWYSFDSLRKKFTDTEWIRNTRYIADDGVVTTTGVTASIPVSLAIVEAIAGRERAAAVASTLGAQDWSAAHRSERFQLSGRDMLTAAENWLAFWSHEEIGIPIADGVDEITLALVADAYSRTYRSNAFSISPTVDGVTTRHGLVVLPDRTSGAAADHTVDLPADSRPVKSLDDNLRKIGTLYGPATADFVALQIEYAYDRP